MNSTKVMEANILSKLDRMFKKSQLKNRYHGKGQYLDDIYIQQFWRTIKYDYIFEPGRIGIRPLPRNR